MANEVLCEREAIEYHGYTVRRDGTVTGKRGQVLSTERRYRRGGGYDLCVRLSVQGQREKWTLQRLVAACFLGPIRGYEINHKDRDPTNNHVDNLERVTAKENQRHWRACNARQTE
jgi:hypothetical protein